MSTNKKKRRVVISDVAKAAGCSPATVSRVLSNSGYPVSEELKQRIYEAASKLGYLSDPNGRILRTAVNPSVGIIIPSFQNPFFSQIIMGIVHLASKRGYTSVVYSSQRDPALERKYIFDLIQKQIGCLFLCSVDDSPDTLKKYISSGGLACVFESNFPPLSEALNATADMFKAAQIATEYLISQGHKKIAFLTPPLSRYSRRQRVDGFKFAMSMHGLTIDPEDVITVSYEGDIDEGLYEYTIGITLAQKMLKQKKKYTAVIALNDLIACGVIAGLKQNNIRVPDDISVIGFDDIPNSVMISPQLTTIRLFGEVIGQRAAQMIIDSFESNERINNITLTVNPELVIRESVRDIRK
ncbi:HTH-type transcriptional repressor PurR [Thermoclostridium stercorarium subsp. stercorarium DSM 8532]|uniref:HTH-type transcriptional repressor PurR n=1 Tax=Thermoclostridium stercorarium (strain ATCC 35414 / DSM 8532 / NCIMB 11754) TaxID=1121335 RepID=L7VSH2_THES1|nr:LacI family DNA-binding transcriptional regulator [Thermoclostridium stercorarium]AGC69697.1 HTH-type transcriptional repressor PurR [Thermoclostridium stercorarium subsp. stercorarium DSM 8532]UZQ85632.1 LacI family transcriptional regulator [Thermoclostridium stercorarium]